MAKKAPTIIKIGGVEVELLTFEGAGHGFRGADADKAEAATIAFFERQLRAP